MKFSALVNHHTAIDSEIYRSVAVCTIHSRDATVRGTSPAHARWSRTCAVATGRAIQFPSGGSNRGERRGGARRSSLEDAIPDCKNTERRDSDLRICSTTISNHTRNRARASFPLSSRSRSVRPLGHSGGTPRSWPVHSRPDVWTRSLDCPPWCRRRNCGGNGAVRTGRISATHGLTTRARLTDRFAPGRANDDTEIDTHSRGN